MRRLMAAMMLLCSFGTVAAAEQNDPQKGQFYISPGFVAHEGPDSRSVGHDDLDVGVGLILGYSFTERWSVELLGSRVESDFDNIFGSGEDDTEIAWIDVLYKLKSNSAWQPFLLAGWGYTEYEFENVRGDASDRQLNAGIGVFRELSNNISLRADVRGVSSRKAGGLEPFAFVGITGFIGEGSGARAPADADGDGVVNEDDRCPTTPPGRIVDASGCQLDGDNDGVVDADDQCPNSAPGAVVDERGCSDVADSDNDGVPDDRDRCPDTDAGALVDENGCYIELEEEVTIDMNIEFDTDKADIRADHIPELNRAVNFLREYPSTQAVIEGHTDSDGSAAYNLALSERRAAAVYRYLIDQAGISAGRLSSAGFGESQPIADNNSAEGKQRNRRVTAVVSGTHKVRQ